VTSEPHPPDPAIDDRPELTPAVLAAVERGIGAPCAACSRALCGHDVVMSYVLGFKGSTRCLACLAFGLGRPGGQLRDHLIDHIGHRDCWRAGWRRADELEGFGARRLPTCALGAAAERAGAHSPQAPAAAGSAPRHDAEWDAGDLGCGDLVLELRIRMSTLRPQQTLRLTARDPGAPADLPAWCGLTGHLLLDSRHPVYVIRRRAD